MEKVYSEVWKLTVKNLQKCIRKMNIDIRGMYKEDKDYFVDLLVDALKVSDFHLKPIVLIAQCSLTLLL